MNDTKIWNDVKEWKRIFSDLGILSDDRFPLDFRVEEYAKNLCGQCSYCQRKRDAQSISDPIYEDDTPSIDEIIDYTVSYTLIA